MTHPSLEQSQRPQNWGALISDTHNFYQISQDFYRSEQPNSELIPLLKKYQIFKKIMFMMIMLLIQIVLSGKMY